MTKDQGRRGMIMEDKAKALIESMEKLGFDEPQSTHDGVRDRETKKAFTAYIKRHPEQRFFQAVTNFVREEMNLNCWGLCIAEAPDKTNGLKEVFYIEGDPKLKNLIVHRGRKERIRWT